MAFAFIMVTQPTAKVITNQKPTHYSEEECTTANIKPSNYNLRKSCDYIIEDITETEQPTETLTEETTTDFVFQPYTFWYDYNYNSGTVTQVNEMPLSTELQKYIYDLCQQNHIGFDFIMAQIGAETDFDCGSRSEAGAVGLMQIRTCHEELFTELGIIDLYNPYDNVLCGVTMMSRLFSKYGEPNLSLMAYNSGEGGARKKWRNGIYSTAYTEEVLTVAKMYEDSFGY